jgi:hypothetical protein
VGLLGNLLAPNWQDIIGEPAIGDTILHCVSQNADNTNLKTTAHNTEETFRITR